jgi:vacuolar-type H+-ATPase subunit I/STV1
MTKEARRTIVQYALFRWENAVVLAGTIVLTGFMPHPFPWWPIWGWSLLGLLGIGAIFYSSLTNVERNAQLLLEFSQEKFDLKVIQQPELRDDVELALEYQRRIESQVHQKGRGILWEKPGDTASQLNDWIGNVYRIAKRLDTYRRDGLLDSQRETVPEEIQSLKASFEQEDNLAFKKQLKELLDSKVRQWETLQALDARMKQAELQLKQTLAAMATVDNQVKLIDAQDVESGRSDRLRADIREQVNRLNDLIGSINEVYDYRTPGVK